VSSAIRNKVMMVSALILVCLGIVAPTFFKDDLPKWWPASPIKLGLDLRGGVYLVMGVETKEAIKSRLTSVGSVVRSDLRSKGVAVAKARVSGERQLSFELLTDKGLPQLEDHMLQEYASLQRVSEDRTGGKVTVVYEMTEREASEVEASAVDQAIEVIRNRVDQYGVSEPIIQRNGEKQIIVQLPDVKDVSAVKRTIGSVAKLEFRLVSDPTKSAAQPSVTRKSRRGGEVRLEDEILMTGDVVDRAHVDINPQTNEAEVSLQLNPVGATMFDRITSQNVGKQLAIILDDISQSEPRINERIGGGRAQITGSFTPEEAHFLAVVLRAGALPAPLKFLEERTVGASLGADSIRGGVYASLIGCIAVFIFGPLYYRRAGLFAVICLGLNILFLLALLVIMKATLTLPGIAGLALTVGMALDANIITFERIREELRAGAGNLAAIEAGFHRAHWAVMDSNLTTLLSGIILYALGTGPIKGFAVTLSLGIVTTLFSALFVCRLMIDSIGLNNRAGKLSI